MYVPFWSAHLKGGHGTDLTKRNNLFIPVKQEISSGVGKFKCRRSKNKLVSVMENRIESFV